MVGSVLHLVERMQIANAVGCAQNPQGKPHVHTSDQVDMVPVQHPWWFNQGTMAILGRMLGSVSSHHAITKLHRAQIGQSHQKPLWHVILHVTDAHTSVTVSLVATLPKQHCFLDPTSLHEPRHAN